jgi:hypothetical protein
MRVSLQTRDREMEPLIDTFHMARRLFRIRRERSVGNPKETPCSRERRTPPTGRWQKGGSEVGVLLEICLELGVNNIKLLLLAPPASHSTGGTLITDIRVFVRGRIARNPAVLQPGLIGPFVRILRLPRPHDPPTRLLVRDHLSFPRPPQERLVALTERCTRPSQPTAAADAARSRERSVVSRADAPSVELPRAVRHGTCPLPNDGPQLVCIKVLEVVTLAARSGYVL